MLQGKPRTAVQSNGPQTKYAELDSKQSKKICLSGPLLSAQALAQQIRVPMKNHGQHNLK